MSGSTVGLILDAMGAACRRLNDYLVALHVSAGLALLAFSVDDIISGGPARPMIVPILGAYMSAAVVFHTVLKDKSPTLLLWINGLCDVVLLIAAHRLAFISLGGLEPDVSVSLLIMAAAIVYGAAGQTRLTIAIGAIITVFFCWTLVSPSTGYPVFDLRSVASLLIVMGSSFMGFRMARAVRRRELSLSIDRLERLEAAVAIHRLHARNGGPS